VSERLQNCNNFVTIFSRYIDFSSNSRYDIKEIKKEAKSEKRKKLRRRKWEKL